MRAIHVTSFGGPEVLELVDVPTPTPHGDLVLLEVIAAGVNFADTHQAADDYLSPQTLPLIPGAEAVGTDPSGRRVVALVDGGYAERVLAHPSVTFALPDSVDDVSALGLVLQGTTAWHLLRTCARIVPGESVVVHAAAGGVGSLAVQLAKRFGAGRVIATASTDDKRKLALDLGADAAIDPGPADGDETVTDALRDALLEVNDGDQVDIVLEMTGGRVFDGSLAALAPFGRLVTYGTASRISGSPVIPGSLVATSRSVSGFWLSLAARLPGGLRPAMDELLDLVGLGLLRVLEGGRYPLEDARKAHEDLSSRRTHGKLVLDPSVPARLSQRRTPPSHEELPVPDIDAAFTALPLRQLADAALSRARELGAEHADIRIERIKDSRLSLHDARLDGSTDGEDVGFAVRVLHEGSWGFASHIDLSPESAQRMAELAVEVARVSKPLSTQPVELADEPSYGDVTWVSPYEVDPFSVPDRDKVSLLADWSAGLLAHDVVTHADASLHWVLENKFYADLAGTTTTQQRVRLQCQLEAVGVDKESGRFDTMRTLAAPVARGWEFLTGSAHDWQTELDELPAHLAEKLRAPSVEGGTYDLVIDPTNLFLTIHESIGHATELDRALGYEANYAGTSFATFDQLGSLRYGSEVMNVTGDRTAENGLSTIGWDDEGVAGQQWDIVKGGVLVGYQLDRAMAHLKGLGRSNGCAFADSAGHVPMQRMANVSLQPAADGPSTDELLAQVERGIYIVGDKSWSIDMQRYNFQFTGQRFFRIENGALAGQLRDVAYQATTTDFWGSLEAVGGPETYVLGGAFNCGKGQPGQVAAVSHGCPSTLFRGIRILNTQAEAGR